MTSLRKPSIVRVSWLGIHVAIDWKFSSSQKQQKPSSQHLSYKKFKFFHASSQLWIVFLSRDICRFLSFSWRNNFNIRFLKKRMAQLLIISMAWIFSLRWCFSPRPRLRSLVSLYGHKSAISKSITLILV